jgi:hypothetical protein
MQKVIFLLSGFVVMFSKEVIHLVFISQMYLNEIYVNKSD